MPAHASRRSSSWHVVLDNNPLEAQGTLPTDLMLSTQPGQEEYLLSEEPLKTPVVVPDISPTTESFVSPDITSRFDYGNQETSYMLFDSTRDTQGLNEELDRLFNSLPSDPDMHDSYNLTDQFVSPCSISPSDTNSHQSLVIAMGTAYDMWVDVAEKVMSALEPMPPSLRNNSFFEPANLENFYYMYFSNYNAHFPILHQASFSCRDAPPLLLLAILTLGATLSEEEHFAASKAIHDKLRWLVFSVSSCIMLDG